MNWTIASDRDGFFIIDDEGYDLTPTWRSKSLAGAEERLRAMIIEALEAEEENAMP